MTTAQQRLHHALDALGRTARPGPPVGGCEYCCTPAQLAALSGPPDLLPDGLLHSVAARNPDHWDGFEALYRRLAPRILRQLTTGTLHVDAPLIGSRLAAAEWRGWDSADLVAEVLDAWWPVVLDDPSPSPAASEVLGTLAVATGSVTPWLSSWARTATPTANRHLQDAADSWLSENDPLGIGFGFYGELPVGRELMTWLSSLPEDRLGADRRYWLDLVAKG
ncbi:hypothetical protein [Streptomyces sp. TLI_171]|uniref:hypothetical protein n=1 Tax=Streptomyces sp. TLI_171 TaxID=1938859 RepID=UPI000C175696|nr:hypothetical protein [Streptomyces sp. TLI_171]RKE17816.1 hypothetical protein BX266_1086 [Streptomyces sp. TLI_171]